MARIPIGAAIAFCLQLLAFGQEYAASPQTPTLQATGSAPAPPSISSVSSSPDGSGDNVVLKDGQAIVMRSMRRLSSETASAGEAVQFEVVKPVVVGDLVVISDHAVATGRIVVAEKKKRRLRDGKLAIVIERVDIVTGETASLRPLEVRGAKVIDYSQPLDFGPGVIFAAPVIMLAAHGTETEIHLAARATTYLDGDLVLDGEAVRKAQTGLPKPREHMGTVYVYRSMDSGDYLNNFTSVSCGEVLLGLFHPGQFVSLELPPGQYSLRAGVPFRVGATVDKKYVDPKNKHFFLLNVEPGRAYYLRTATRSRHWADSGYLEQVDQATGAEAVFAAESWADLGLEEITPETLWHLQAQPKTRSGRGGQGLRD